MCKCPELFFPLHLWKSFFYRNETCAQKSVTRAFVTPRVSCKHDFCWCHLTALPEIKEEPMQYGKTWEGEDSVSF